MLLGDKENTKWKRTKVSRLKWFFSFFFFYSLTLAYAYEQPFIVCLSSFSLWVNDKGKWTFHSTEDAIRRVFFPPKEEDEDENFFQLRMKLFSCFWQKFFRDFSSWAVLLKKIECFRGENLSGIMLIHWRKKTSHIQCVSSQTNVLLDWWTFTWILTSKNSKHANMNMGYNRLHSTKRFTHCFSRLFILQSFINV